MIKYTDGTTASTTVPCIIGAYGDKGATGAQGPQGNAGATGKGIKSVTEKYAVSSSNTTPPTSWSTTLQTMTSVHKYLWNYETITYTDNTTSDTTKRVIGVYGDTGAKGDKGATGAAGKGVKSTEIAYQASTSGTTIPTGTWTASIPTVSAGSFLWTRSIITYTDNSKSTSYSIGKMGNTGATGAKGDKGAAGPTGAAGKGVKSTAITYQAGSSGTSAPTGTWSTSIPATSASKPFLWTKTVITYTDNGTSTIYSVGSTPDSIQVGGRNLARGTSSEWSKWYTPTNNTNNHCEVFCNIYPGDKKIDDIFVVSFDIDVKKFTKGSNGTFALYLQGSVDDTWNIRNLFTRYDFTNKAIAGDYTEHVSYLCKIEVSSQVSASKFQLAYRCNYSDGTGKFRVRNIKVEKGNKATDWTPAPEDIDNRFDAAETRITQAETSIETTSNQVALKASTETVTEIGNRANQLDKALSDALITINKNSEAIASLTARDFKVEFTTLTNQLTQLNGDLTSYKKEVGNWMRFDADGNLVLGATRTAGQDAYELKLTKNRISFMLNDDEVAYISNNELYITNSTVVQNLKIGRFVWEVRGNGNLGLVWR